MPTLQEHRNRRRRELEIRELDELIREHEASERRKWLQLLRNTYLGNAMQQYGHELIRERRARNRQGVRNGPGKPRMNFILAPRSIIMTMTGEDIETFIAMICTAISLVLLIKIVRIVGGWLTGSAEKFNAAEIRVLGQFYLLLVFDLMRMWWFGTGNLRYRIEMTSYVLVAGLWLRLLAKWDGVSIWW